MRQRGVVGGQVSNGYLSFERQDRNTDRRAIGQGQVRLQRTKGKYKADGEELEYKESGNMPEWAEDEPQINEASLKDQYFEAAEAGDERAMAHLNREPGVHIGPHNVARAERGEDLEWLENTRKQWADHANEALERAGRAERINEASLETQYFEAAENVDERSRWRGSRTVSRGCISGRTT